MSNRTRAFRRHHRMRMLNRARRKLYIWAFDDGTWGEEYARRNYDHLAACSCHMCGNPRHNIWLPKKEKLTIQERKVYNVLSEEMEDHFASSNID